MQVWIVYYSDYEGDELVEIFDSEEKAKAYIAKAVRRPEDLKYKPMEVK